MNKRLLCLLLVFALLVPVIPSPARAEQLRQVTVTVRTWREHPVTAYYNGYDLYFSEETMTEFAEYFEYNNNGKTITYTRGAKEIQIDPKKGNFKVLFNGNFPLSAPLELPMEKIDELWYFSGATLLPWLNVKVSEEDGKLVVVPDEYSFWDIYSELDLEDYSVSYGDLVREYAWNSKVVKAMHYFTDSTGQALQEKLGFEDEYGGSSEDYFDILECYLLDTAHTEYTADVLSETWDTLMGFYDLISIEYDPLSKFFDIFDAFDEGLVFASHFYAFSLHHADRMETIDQILLHRRTDRYTAHLAEGALLAENSYTNLWQGILNTYVLNLDEALAEMVMDKVTDKLANNPITEVLLLVLDISTKEIKDLNRRIQLMAPMYNLYLTGREVYETSYGEDIRGLTDLRCHAVLSLFAAAENCRTLSTYSKKHKLDDLASKYARMAEECDDWINKLNACTLSQANDSIEYRNGSSWETSKRRYGYDLEDTFEKLALYEPPQNGLETVEYGMFLAYAQELPVENPGWKLTGSGQPRDLLFGGSVEFEGESRTFQHYLSTSGLASQFRSLTDNLPKMDNPALTDQNISGDTGKLMEALNDYLTQRKHYLCSFRHDFNADGKADALYILPEAVSLWLDVIDIPWTDEDLGKSVFTPDKMDTLVLAETDKDGIHVRIMRLSPAPHYELTPEGVLTGGTSFYSYQAEGVPFVVSEEGWSCLLDYCTADYGTIYSDLGETSYTNPDIYGDGGNIWNCSCMLSEGLSMVFDFASDYEDTAATPIYARIDDLLYWSGSTCGAELSPGLKMGMTYAEIAKTIDLSEMNWAPEQTWTDPVWLCYGGASGCALELYFVGSSEETAVLVSANATPLGEERTSQINASIMDMLYMSYDELSGLSWKEWYYTTSMDDPNSWTGHGIWDDCHYTIQFGGTPGDAAETPWLVIVQDMNSSGASAVIFDDVTTGMTYDDVKIYGVPTPMAHDTGWGAACYYMGHSVSFHFDGDSGDALITGAEIIAY